MLSNCDASAGKVSSPFAATPAQNQSSAQILISCTTTSCSNLLSLMPTAAPNYRLEEEVGVATTNNTRYLVKDARQLLPQATPPSAPLESLKCFESFDAFGGLMNQSGAQGQTTGRRCMSCCCRCCSFVICAFVGKTNNNNYLDNNFRYLRFSRAQREAK